MPNAVAVDLEDINARDGWILESRIYQQGGTEVGLLPVCMYVCTFLAASKYTLPKI